MASSKFELLRSACEAVENSEKVLAIAYQNRKKFLNKMDTAPVASGPAPGEDGQENDKGTAVKQPVSDAILS